jgi:hypothetical protein
LSSVFCLTASLVSSCNLRDCIALRSNIYYLNLFSFLFYGNRDYSCIMSFYFF